jgi:hypothetical protein
MSKINDPLRDKWASLGIAFSQKTDLVANPEQTIIETIKSGEFPADRKLFSLMLLWLNEFVDLVHVERLKGLLGELAPFELAIMGGLATKCLKMGDFRWKAILNEVQKKLGKHPPKFDVGDDATYLKLKGVDADFEAFGIKVAPLKPEDHKKLVRRDEIIKNNPWLKNRLLMGSNLRADFITIFTLGLARNAYQAAKILNCSENASYRNWRSLEEARELGLV